MKITKNSIRLILFQSAISLILLILTGVVIVILMAPKVVPKSESSRLILDTVEAVPIEEHHGGIDFRTDGEVIPFRQLDVVPEIAGRVIYKSEHCRLGHSVCLGEILLRIDPTDYQHELEQLTEALKQANIAIAENDVQIANTQKELDLAAKQLELRKRDWERNQSLAQRNAISVAELDSVQSSLLTVEETIQKLRNQLSIYEVQKNKLMVTRRREEISVKTAQLNLERTEVRSPLGGIVTADTFEVNSFIQRGAGVAKILDISQLEIQCSLYMKQIQWIWRQSGSDNNGYIFPPTPVTILYEIDGERWSWAGTLKTLDGGGLNAVTRMIPCRVKVDDPHLVRPVHVHGVGGKNAPPTLFAGMYVSIVVHSQPAVSLYRIPEKALLPGNIIWTATNGQLQRHAIHVATTVENNVLFYADSDELSPTDLVVVSPIAAPVEGRNVQVINAGTKNVAQK
ncbi:MAG: HlyD family efflux transporter periplasmic adaptor subunit [Planctomycetaceae bacterium]|jgi:multidrug efflux pump subunit AcrA (membrane-fusion protein)|nr:HlyD family efflux transporter periplasmic adaptor subunit [Planctomycetaceae bacterium]